jgi:hypothetical protein
MTRLSSNAKIRVKTPRPRLNTLRPRHWQRNVGLVSFLSFFSSEGPCSDRAFSFFLAAAWEFYEKHKSEVDWDLSVLNPSWVFGVSRNVVCLAFEWGFNLVSQPVIHNVSTVDDLGVSCRAWYDAVVKGDFGGSPLTIPGHGWVDVRDVAEAHVRALQIPAAGGERIIVCAGSYVWQDWSMWPFRSRVRR